MYRLLKRVWFKHLCFSYALLLTTDILYVCFYWFKEENNWVVRWLSKRVITWNRNSNLSLILIRSSNNIRFSFKFKMQHFDDSSMHACKCFFFCFWKQLNESNPIDLIIDRLYRFIKWSNNELSDSQSSVYFKQLFLESMHNIDLKYCIIYKERKNTKQTDFYCDQAIVEMNKTFSFCISR